jgi:hypothetical protein
LISEWVKNKWYIHTTEYYLTLILKREKKFCNMLDYITLSEINQLQKDKYCMIPLKKCLKSSNP